ncbi:MAG: hypothetical protein AABY93_04985 [Bacteroidota bacterium]
MSRTSTILLILILIFTFPVWIALAAVVFGLIAGIFGGIIGLIGGIFGGIAGLLGGIFGGIMGLIGGIFDAIFNPHSWGFNWGWHPNFHFNGYVFFALIIIIALIINKRQNR